MKHASQLYDLADKLQERYNLKPAGGGIQHPPRLHSAGGTTTSTTPSRCSETSGDMSTNVDDSVIHERSRELEMLSKIKELQRHETIMKTLAEKTQKQVEELQQRLSYFVKENVELKQTIKHGIETAFIAPLSEPEYMQYKDVPATQIDWSTWVKLCLYNYIAEYTHHSTQVHALTSTNTRLKHDVEESQRLFQNDIVQLKERLKLYEDRNAALEAQLIDSSRQLDTCKGKAMEYDSLRRTARDTEEEKGGLDIRVRVLSQELDATKEELHRDKLTLQHVQVELKWLQRESAALQQKCKDYEETKFQLEKDLREANQRKEAALETLHSEKERLRQQYETTLQKEVQRLEQNAAQDLERVRSAGRDVVERETRALREARDAALLEIERMRREVTEGRQTIENMRNEFKATEDTLQTRNFELQAQLRLKLSEVGRLEALQKQSEETHTKSTLQLDCQERKLSTLKQEFYDMKIFYETKAAERESVITALENKLKFWSELDIQQPVVQLSKFQSDVMSSLQAKCRELQEENQNLTARLTGLLSDVKRMGTYQAEITKLKDCIVAMQGGGGGRQQREVATAAVVVSKPATSQQRKQHDQQHAAHNPHHDVGGGNGGGLVFGSDPQILFYPPS